MKMSVKDSKKLRYGENRHQVCHFFGNLDALFEQLHGKEISYMVAENGVENIWSQPLDGADPYRVTNFDSGTIGTNWAPSPDGKRMVVSRGSESTDVVLLRAK